MSIERSSAVDNFAVVPFDLIRDPNLSNAALGFLVRVLFSGWDPDLADEISVRLLSEVETAGYVVRLEDGLHFRDTSEFGPS